MKKRFIIIPVSIVILLSGCRAATGTVERAQPVGTPQGVEDKRVMPDMSLRHKIAIIQVNEGVVSGDLTKAQVIVRNRKSSSITINYAWDWYDINGMLVPSYASTYKQLRLAGDEQKALSTIAPKPTAVDFVLKLQEPRPFFKRHDLNPFNP
jgi:uncharacterized protein YcfL